MFLRQPKSSYEHGRSQTFYTIKVRSERGGSGRGRDRREGEGKGRRERMGAREERVKAKREGRKFIDLFISADIRRNRSKVYWEKRGGTQTCL